MSSDPSCGTLSKMNEITPYLTRLQGLEIIYVGFGLGLILTVVEIMNRRGLLHPEFARKSIHISAGLLLAALPIFMTRPQIFLTNVAFLLGVLILTGWLHIFNAVHAVKRWTIGEFLYPLAGALIALTFDDLRVYTVSIMVLALSDGLAGLFGRQYGGKGYKVWGGTKSLVGNAVFFVTTLFILVSFTLISIPDADTAVWLLVFGGSVFLTCVEAFFGGGFDNLMVPVVTAVITASLLAL